MFLDKYCKKDIIQPVKNRNVLICFNTNCKTFKHFVNMFVKHRMYTQRGNIISRDIWRILPPDWKQLLAGQSLISSDSFLPVRLVSKPFKQATKQFISYNLLPHHFVLCSIRLLNRAEYAIYLSSMIENICICVFQW